MKNNILLFGILFFLQVFVLNKVLFYQYIILSPILIILLLYKYQKNSKENLLFSFLIGVLIDIFNNSLGVYALTCLIIVYFRNFWVLKIVGEEKTEEINTMTVHELGILQNTLYAIPIIVLFFSLLSLFESDVFFSINNLLFIIISSFINYIFILLFQYLFFDYNIRDEWR
tara:strand:+ start:10229 stop:10741 length:513 start_codon:yes stop_codon:yes gene_type:complete